MATTGSAVLLTYNTPSPATQTCREIRVCPLRDLSRTPSKTEDVALQSNGSPHDPEKAHGNVAGTENGHQLEDGAAKYPRIIVSFPRGDPENPYNWSTVNAIGTHWGDDWLTRSREGRSSSSS
ncbi:MAG: hypothetical protein Q9169_003997 [Polycauliona sp. 2 TL-2023]